MLMKKLCPSVQSFTVEVNGRLREINDIPMADLGANTAEKSEVSEDYIIENGEYSVTVYVNYDDIAVEVYDSCGNVVEDFNIIDVHYNL